MATALSGITSPSHHDILSTLWPPESTMVTSPESQVKLCQLRICHSRSVIHGSRGP